MCCIKGHMAVLLYHRRRPSSAAGRTVELPVCLRLSCQQFVELVRRGQILEAVAFGQQVTSGHVH